MSTKQEQLTRLNEQLAMLHSNLSDFDGLVKETAGQYQSIQNLAIMHGSLFMASHTVFGNNYNADTEQA